MSNERKDMNKSKCNYDNNTMIMIMMTIMTMTIIIMKIIISFAIL